jgi:hypothetical protein
MTDLETIQAIMNRAGIGYDVSPIMEYTDGQYIKTLRTQLEFVAKDHDKVDGYGGFTTQLRFNRDGSLDSMEIWE